MEYFHQENAQNTLTSGIFGYEIESTELMVADFSTKHLQGKLFQRLEKVIMGQIDIEDFTTSMSDVPKERVGDNEVNDLDGTDRINGGQYRRNRPRQVLVVLT